MNPGLALSPGGADQLALLTAALVLEIAQGDKLAPRCRLDPAQVEQGVVDRDLGIDRDRGVEVCDQIALLFFDTAGRGFNHGLEDSARSGVVGIGDLLPDLRSEGDLLIELRSKASKSPHDSAPNLNPVPCRTPAPSLPCLGVHRAESRAGRRSPGSDPAGRLHASV